MLFKGFSCSYNESTLVFLLGDKNPEVYFETPNFGGAGRYLPDLHCTWAFEAPLGHRLRLEFESPVHIRNMGFDVSALSPVFAHIMDLQDAVWVIDGPVEIARLTGDVLTPEKYLSDGNRLTVKFSSFFFHQRRGFYAKVSLM